MVKGDEAETPTQREKKSTILLGRFAVLDLTVSEVLNLASRCLHGELFGSINGVILVNPNRPTSQPGDPLGYLVFAHVRCTANGPSPRSHSNLYKALGPGVGRGLRSVATPKSRRHRKPSVFGTRVSATWALSSPTLQAAPRSIRWSIGSRKR
jgi:hypothetical protein